MGIPHLKGYITYNLKRFGVLIDMNEKKYLVDSNSFIFYVMQTLAQSSSGLESGLSMGIGGHYIGIFDALERIIVGFLSCNIELVFIFESSIDDEGSRLKSDTLKGRREQQLQVAVNFFTYLQKQDKNLKCPSFFPVPFLFKSLLKDLLEKWNIQMIFAEGEADSFIAKKLKNDKSFDAVLSNDSDYIIFDESRWIMFDQITFYQGDNLINVFSPSALDNLPDNVKGIFVSKETFCTTINLPPHRLVEVALLCGCDITKPLIPKSQIEEIVSRRTARPNTPINFTKTSQKFSIPVPQQAIAFLKALPPDIDVEDDPEIKNQILMKPELGRAFHVARLFYNLDIDDDINMEDEEQQKLIISKITRFSCVFNPKSEKNFQNIIFEPLHVGRMTANKLCELLRVCAYSCLGITQVNEVVQQEEKIIEQTINVPGLEQFMQFSSYLSDKVTCDSLISIEENHECDDRLQILYILIMGACYYAVTKEGFITSEQLENLDDSHIDPLFQLDQQDFLFVLILRQMIWVGNSSIDNHNQHNPMTIKALSCLVRMWNILRQAEKNTDRSVFQLDNVVTFDSHLLRIASWYQLSVLLVSAFANFFVLDSNYIVPPYKFYDAHVFANCWFTQNSSTFSENEDAIIQAILWQINIEYGNQQQLPIKKNFQDSTSFTATSQLKKIKTNSQPKVLNIQQSITKKNIVPNKKTVNQTLAAKNVAPVKNPPAKKNPTPITPSPKNVSLQPPKQVQVPSKQLVPNRAPRGYPQNQVAQSFQNNRPVVSTDNLINKNPRTIDKATLFFNILILTMLIILIFVPLFVYRELKNSSI